VNLGRSAAGVSFGLSLAFATHPIVFISQYPDIDLTNIYTLQLFMKRHTPFDVEFDIGSVIENWALWLNLLLETPFTLCAALHLIKDRK